MAIVAVKQLPLSDVGSEAWAVYRQVGEQATVTVNGKFEVPVTVFEEPDGESLSGHREWRLLHGDDRSRDA